MSTFANIYITHNDETKTLHEWSKVFGLDYPVVLTRYKRGIRGADLFKQPRKYKKRKAGLPDGMTRTEALLLGLDDYDRDHVRYYSDRLNITPTEFVHKALAHAFKILDNHLQN